MFRLEHDPAQEGKKRRPGRRESELVERLDRVEVAAAHLLRIMDSLQLPAMRFGTAREFVEKTEALRVLVIPSKPGSP
jgi:hypothetical protein